MRHRHSAQKSLFPVFFARCVPNQHLPYLKILSFRKLKRILSIPSQNILVAFPARVTIFLKSFYYTRNASQTHDKNLFKKSSLNLQKISSSVQYAIPQKKYLYYYDNFSI